MSRIKECLMTTTDVICTQLGERLQEGNNSEEHRELVA